MQIAQTSLTPNPGIAETRHWPRTAPLPRQAESPVRIHRLNRRTLVIASAVIVCVVFPVALATAVYYVAGLIWKI